MRVLINSAETGLSVISISEIFYSSSDCQLRFYSPSSDSWYEFYLKDCEQADDIICTLFSDGLYDLSDFITYQCTKIFLED